MADPVDITLTLDAESLARAERYSVARGTSVSDVVNTYLRGLPEPTPPPAEWERGLPPHTAKLREIARRGDEDASERLAAVRRLWRIAQPEAGFPAGADAREEYRAYLWKKYVLDPRARDEAV